MIIIIMDNKRWIDKNDFPVFSNEYYYLSHDT